MVNIGGRTGLQKLDIPAGPISPSRQSARIVLQYIVVEQIRRILLDFAVQLCDKFINIAKLFENNIDFFVEGVPDRDKGEFVAILSEVGLQQFVVLWGDEFLEVLVGELEVEERIETKQIFKQLKKIVLVKAVTLADQALDQQHQQDALIQHQLLHQHLLLLVTQAQLNLVQVALLLQDVRLDVLEQLPVLCLPQQAGVYLEEVNNVALEIFLFYLVCCLYEKRLFFDFPLELLKQNLRTFIIETTQTDAFVRDFQGPRFSPDIVAVRQRILFFGVLDTRGMSSFSGELRD